MGGVISGYSSLTLTTSQLPYKELITPITISRLKYFSSSPNKISVAKWFILNELTPYIISLCKRHVELTLSLQQTYPRYENNPGYCLSNNSQGHVQPKRFEKSSFLFQQYVRQMS